MQNFFSFFGLPPVFDLDTGVLEKAYFSTQRQVHPDRLTGKNAAERQQAIAQSMLANEAYEALKSPLKRAQHLLLLSGIAEQKPSQSLLMENMEQREMLADAGSAQDVEKVAQTNEAAKQETLVALSHAFLQPDHAKAAELAMRLSYLMKLEDEIRVRKKIVAAG